MKTYNFPVTCIANYVEDDECYWTKGQKYSCKTSDFKTFEIKTNLGTTGCVGEGFLCDDFHKVFSTDFRVPALPIPAEWLSHEVLDDIYRDVWSDYVEKDIRDVCSGNGISLSDDSICDAAYRYTHEGEYDCDLSYWSNIDNLISQYRE